METIIYIGIYLIGCVVSYLVMKKNTKKDFLLWTKKDRIIALTFSIFSWIAVIAELLAALVFSTTFNEEAKW